MDNVMSVLSCLDGLSSLKSLSWLAQNYIQLPNEGFQTVLETISSKMLHLEVLDISENHLTNEILPFLRGFKSLKELYLRRIGLDSDLHIQGLCAVLKNLEILDISWSNFNDTDIASALSGLSSLKSLNLEGSEITPRSIRNISKLRSLEILDISGNNFKDTDIASALTGLSSLKSLNLEYSKLTLRSIHNISKLRSLEILKLAGNDLSNDILSSLNGLPCLKSLDLSSNNLNGSVDVTGLVTLTSLKILDFSRNKIVDLVVEKGSKTLSRLDTLSLDYNMINGSSLQDSLKAFPSIRNLTLTTNIFKGTILAEGFRGLSNLQYLTLDWSVNLKNEFFKSIGDLPSLKHLSVSYCSRELNGTLPVGDWSKLKKLEKLDLSYNELDGQLPSSFVNMTSLRTLILTYNNFIGKIGPNFASFTSLEYLNFEGNQFEFPISFTPFANNSNLKFLYGNGNKVILDPPSTLKTWVPKFQLRMLQLYSITEANSIPLPKFLLYQYHLTYVDFTGCKLRGEFPNWLLENNTKMEALFLENCSFIGNFQLPSHPHFNMATIDISNNAISSQMLSNNVSSIFPNLVDLNMSRNAIHGSIHYELSHLSSLESLDLSDNQLRGELPHELFGQLNSLKYLLLDRNILSGTIPSNIFNVSNIKCLDISNNNFIGKIPSQINTWLVELSMSNNHFEGSIPSELVEFERLTYLDLSQNKLSGCVPSVANFFADFIHLNNNNLSCLTKNMSGERSSSMTVLDLSNNDIVHGIHDLIHDLRDTGLNILLLKGNHFTGHIPKQLCHLTKLNILDLSFNKFVGEIPSCLGKMRFENEDPDASRNEFNGFSAAMGWITYYRFGKEKDNFTSKKISETYTTSILIYMSGIDLSHNELNGSIPSELGNLTRIRALNLSNNFFTGKIPATFSNLVQVESLDLSFNTLSGQIPPQLTGLTFIEVFSVAHNNLSGATPERKGQFITFDETSYEGNQFLCGLPLPKSCNPSGQGPATLPNGSNNDEENDSWVDMYVFRVSFIVAYTSMLLVIAIVLYINPYWRRAWFYYIGLVGMNCYYFIEDNLCKLF